MLNRLTDMNDTPLDSPSRWRRRSHQQGDPQQYLRVDHLRDDLGHHSVRSSAVMLASNAVQLLVAVGSIMVLARLLTPKDFGLLAMVSVLTGLVHVFSDFGLPLAVVHQSQVGHSQISRLFWLNFNWNMCVAVFIVAVAPVMVWFFDEPSLLTIIVVMALGIFTVGLTNLHLGLLHRQMRFGVISLMEAGSAIAGAVVGIVLAWQGAGYWALVFQQLTMLLARAGILWSACRWRPARRRELHLQPGVDLHALVSYGKRTTQARFLNYIGDNFDRVLVARLAGATQLGLYYNAHHWSFFPINQLYLPLKGIVIAGSSRLQNNPDQYRAYMRSVFLALLAIALPTLGFVCTNAHDVVLFLLGPQWLSTVPLLRIFTLAATADCVRRSMTWIYLSEGQTKRRLHWTLISTPLRIMGTLLGASWGAIGIATGYTIASWVLAYPSVVFCLKTSPLRVRDFWSAAWRPAVAGLQAALLLLALQSVLPSFSPLPLRLAFHAGGFALVYVGLWVIMPGGVQSAKAMIDLLKASRLKAAEIKG